MNQSRTYVSTRRSRCLIPRLDGAIRRRGTGIDAPEIVRSERTSILLAANDRFPLTAVRAEQEACLGAFPVFTKAAARVLDASGKCVAAISVVALEHRLSGADPDRIVAAAATCSARPGAW